MHKHTVHYVIFEAPGSYVSESFKREVAGPDPHAVVWPGHAYAFRLYRREDVTDGDDTYTGVPQQIGKTYYHPHSTVQTYEEAQRNPKATPILLGNMRRNGWNRIVWTRWGTWPQPFDPATTEVLQWGTDGAAEAPPASIPRDEFSGEQLRAAYEASTASVRTAKREDGAGNPPDTPADGSPRFSGLTAEGLRKMADELDHGIVWCTPLDCTNTQDEMTRLQAAQVLRDVAATLGVTQESRRA